MKTVLSMLVLVLASSQAQAIFLRCEPGELHRTVTIVSDSNCTATGLAIAGRDVRACVLTDIEDLTPGSYQICGSYTGDPELFFVRLAVDSRFR